MCKGESPAMAMVAVLLLNEDDFGKVHFEGDHHVRVIRVFRNGLALDRRSRSGLQHRVCDWPRPAAWCGDEVTSGSRTTKQFLSTAHAAG